MFFCRVLCYVSVCLFFVLGRATGRKSCAFVTGGRRLFQGYTVGGWFSLQLVGEAHAHLFDRLGYGQVAAMFFCSSKKMPWVVAMFAALRRAHWVRRRFDVRLSSHVPPLVFESPSEDLCPFYRVDSVL